MNANRILCPVDFSEASNRALDLASKLAREADAKLYIVHVEENAAVTHPGLFGGLPPAISSDKRRLNNTLPTATEVTFEHDMLVGNPVDEIIEFAKQNHIDLIVMGSHGLTGVARVLLGSVAEAVVRKSPVPVLTLKTTSKELSAVE